MAPAVAYADSPLSMRQKGDGGGVWILWAGNSHSRTTCSRGFPVGHASCVTLRCPSAQLPAQNRGAPTQPWQRKHRTNSTSSHPALLTCIASPASARSGEVAAVAAAAASAASARARSASNSARSMGALLPAFSPSPSICWRRCGQGSDRELRPTGCRMRNCRGCRNPVNAHTPGCRQGSWQCLPAPLLLSAAQHHVSPQSPAAEQSPPGPSCCTGPAPPTRACAPPATPPACCTLRHRVWRSRCPTARGWPAGWCCAGRWSPARRAALPPRAPGQQPARLRPPSPRRAEPRRGGWA